MVLVGISTDAQSRKELEKKRKQTEKEIALTKKILEETKQKKEKSLNALVTIGKLIEVRQELIQNISDEVNIVSSEIDNKTAELNLLNQMLERNKKQLAKAVFISYKTRRSSNTGLFLIASENFNQAIKRLQYLKGIQKQQKKLIEQISDKKQEIAYLLIQLQEIKNQKVSLLSEKEQEKYKLESDKKEQDRIFQALSGQEKELREKLKKQQKAAAELDQAIKKIIAKEIEEARKKREAELKKSQKGTAENTETKKGEMVMTPEAKALSSDFSSNKNRLPWPVPKGFISQRFGEHPHPKLSGITINNNGIDIVTESGSMARSVFKGEVSAIINIPGMGLTVLINHGDYYTVYAKLANVLVKKGDKVDSKQELGTIITDENGKTELHFELWHNQSKQNPEYWLSDR